MQLEHVLAQTLFCPRLCFCSLVRVLSQRECIARHGLEVPGLCQILLEGIVPVPLELGGDGPSHRRASKSHTNQVSLLLLGLAIGEALTTMKNGQVVDEVHVTGLCLDLELSGLCDGFNEVKCLLLAIIGLRQMLGSRMGGIAEKRRSAKVHDEARTLLEDDWAALEMRAVSSLSATIYTERRVTAGKTHNAKGQSDLASVRMTSGR